MDAIQERLAKTEEKMKKSVAALDNEYRSIRAGRATPAILDKLTVEYYGAPTKIDQMAAISVPEARLMVIQPWDPTTLSAIHVAKYAEECKVAIRSLRRDANDKLKTLKKNAEITEDDQKIGEEKIQKLTDKYVKIVDEHAKAKEKEIMEI